MRRPVPSPRPRLAALTACVVVGVLAACAPSPRDVELGDGIVPTVDDGEDRPTADPGTGGATASPTATAVAGSGASPAPGACVDVPATEEGVYTVADAGTVTVTATGGALTLGAVEPFAGWATEVTTEEPTEVEVELTKDAEELDLEVEIQEGAPVVRVCADDD